MYSPPMLSAITGNTFTFNLLIKNGARIQNGGKIVEMVVMVRRVGMLEYLIERLSGESGQESEWSQECGLCQNIVWGQFVVWNTLIS